MTTNTMKDNEDIEKKIQDMEKKLSPVRYAFEGIDLFALIPRPEQIEPIRFDSIKATYGDTIDELTLHKKFNAYAEEIKKTYETASQRVNKESEKVAFWHSSWTGLNLWLGTAALGVFLGYVLDIKTTHEVVALAVPIGFFAGVWRSYYLRTSPREYVEKLIAGKQQLVKDVDALNRSFVQSLLDERRKYLEQKNP